MWEDARTANMKREFSIGRNYWNYEPNLHADRLCFFVFVFIYFSVESKAVCVLQSAGKYNTISRSRSQSTVTLRRRRRSKREPTLIDTFLPQNLVFWPYLQYDFSFSYVPMYSILNSTGMSYCILSIYTCVPRTYIRWGVWQQTMLMLPTF